MKLDLLNDTKEILEEVAASTGKKVVFKENENLQFFAVAKAARSRMPSHILYYKPVDDDILNHLIAHECGHILRMHRETETKIMPYSSNAQLNAAVAKIDENTNADFPEDIKSKVYSLWTNGIISQITSFPEDIRIELWIHDNFPQLHESQRRTMQKQIDEITQSSSEKIKEMVPGFLYDGSGIINYCFLNSLASIIPDDVLKMFQSCSFYADADTIYGEVQKIMSKEDSVANSIEVSNFVAQKLGFDTWFDWKDFEDIPDDYENLVC